MQDIPPLFLHIIHVAAGCSCYTAVVEGRMNAEIVY